MRSPTPAIASNRQAVTPGAHSRDSKYDHRVSSVSASIWADHLEADNAGLAAPARFHDYSDD